MRQGSHSHHYVQGATNPTRGTLLLLSFVLGSLCHCNVKQIGGTHERWHASASAWAGNFFDEVAGLGGRAREAVVGVAP